MLYKLVIFDRNDYRADRETDSWRLLNCLYRKQSEKYSAKWDRGLSLR